VHPVRTIPGAVLAADAGIGAVPHNAGHAVFGIRIHRATGHARGLQAMVAAHGKVMAMREGISAAFDFSHPPPEDIGGIAILLVARHHATFAADALRHVEMKSVLFALAQYSERSRSGARPAERARGALLHRVKRGEMHRIELLHSFQ